MNRLVCLPALACLTLLTVAAPLRAQLHLTPTGSVTPPEGHSYVIGMGVRHTEHALRDVFYLYTTQETYQRQFTEGVGEVPGGGTWQKLWDLTQFGVLLAEESLVVRDGSNPNLSYYAGGNTSNRMIVYQQTPPAVLSSTPIAGLQSLPQGMAIRPASGSGPSGLFYSTAYGDGVDPYGPSSNFAPALVYHPDLSSLPVTALPGNTFGTAGPGQVSSGVGALQLGPDGRLNVLDTGDQRIIRYDAETFEYAGEFALGNTNTDRNTFVVSPNGYIFTANSDSMGGSIYNYYTGESVGTYGATGSYPEGGEGGKTSLTVDALGLVIAYNHIGGDEHIFYYDSNQLPPVVPVPEPVTGVLLAGAAALAVAYRRRRTVSGRT